MTKTYAQLAREIATLQATASKLYAIEVKSAVQKVNELIAQYGLSAGDLAFAASPVAGKPASVAKSATAAAQAPGVKYSDGEGRVWGGRGPRPAWLRSAIAAGRSLESFLAAGAADIVATLGPSAGGKAKKAAAGKPAATGVAKFVNPKTGAGWSGRGPRPQWLKDALKKRGSKIEDFLGDKPAMSDAPAAPAAAAPAAPAKKAVAKKSVAPAKKAAAKKVVAKKTAAKKPNAVAAPVAPAKKAAAKKAVKTSAKTAAPAAPAKKVAPTKVTQAAAKKAPAKKTAVPSASPAAPAPAPAAEAAAAVANA